MAEVIKDGYILDIEDIPHGQPVSGREIQQRVAQHTGEETAGVPYVNRDGRLAHVGSDESVTLRPGDRIGFTAPFETA
jgi:hypothetical protein